MGAHNGCLQTKLFLLSIQQDGYICIYRSEIESPFEQNQFGPKSDFEITAETLSVVRVFDTYFVNIAFCVILKQYFYAR